MAQVLELKNVVHAYATMTHDPPAAFTKHKTSLLQVSSPATKKRPHAVSSCHPDGRACSSPWDLPWVKFNTTQNEADNPAFLDYDCVWILTRELCCVVLGRFIHTV